MAVSSMSTFAAGAEPVRHVLRFPAPQTHYVEVEATIPTGGASEVELMMPVWTPGSYLVREFARGIEEMRATGTGGKPLEIVKTRKNRWKVASGGAAEVKVAYRVYCRTMSVQSNWVDASFAMLNGAGIFLTRVDDGSRPHEVALELASAWKTSVSGLPAAPGGRPNHYRAADYDTLVDSPIYAGSPALYEFQVDGVPHVLVNEGEGGLWDGPRSAKDVEAIVRAQKAFWGFLPYERYVFFNLLVESGGGLEHKNSTVLMASRWACRTRPGYLGWLYLVSHEYFHTWNVKRLRPVELGPFDYESEVYTPSLWVAEGITSYYDRLFVRRAGLCTTDEFLAGDPPAADGDKPMNDIERLQTTPGRLVQALEASSLDTWIKFYRRDENTVNSGVSYYLKGSVVAFLLDAKIRRATGGKKSLDDLMRLAYSRYSGEKGFTAAQFRELAREVAGADLSDFFHKALETTEELDYAETLDWFGLHFAPDEKEKKAKKARENKGESASSSPAKPPRAWLGLATKNEDGRLMVTVVKRGTPGYDAGFNAGDEIIAVGDDRIPADQWSKRMDAFRPGESVSILIARRDRLQRIAATFGQEPPRQWTLEVAPGASPAQKEHFKAWVAGKNSGEGEVTRGVRADPVRPAQPGLNRRV
ncbi:M61 family metallopeptidase [Aquisphaera insulae]|uniref:M61 family metallopeptidase n=1 Tax=Aquisphaera insulae TaxID=2712864 RepID=UPI0013EA8B7A|nr:PDZ domain-containing protein [Aquisphaera insulae]